MRFDIVYPEYHEFAFLWGECYDGRQSVVKDLVTVVRDWVAVARA